MEVKQFYDSELAHGSYAILSKGEVAVVDPGRDPKPYENFAKQHNAKIVAVLETHPHADFVSSHLELHKKYNATVYVNPKMGVEYPHKTLNNKESMTVGNVRVEALFTPGHSPDHNSYLLYDEGNTPFAVFTGDSLFIGDVGRPDLREGAGNLKAKREELANQMFDTINDVFRNIPDDVIVYPAHGAGSLCGKNMSKDTSSTMGREKKYNWAFQLNREDFVKELLDGQPFVPKYFSFDVEMNRVGAPEFEKSVKEVKHLDKDEPLKEGIIIIDARPEKPFKEGHIPGAINVQDLPGDKFETWLGAIVAPEEKYYLIADNEEALELAIRRAAKIGYEQFIEGALINPSKEAHTDIFVEQWLEEHPEKYTIVDIRNESEIETSGKTFDHAMHIPLHELRERADEVPGNKEIVVHCAGGYRSATGSSILEATHPGTKVYDLSTAIQKFKTQKVS